MPYNLTKKYRKNNALTKKKKQGTLNLLKDCHISCHGKLYHC